MADKTAIRTERAPAPFQGAPYSQAIRVGDLVFVSGQLALKPDHAEIVGETIQEQTEQVMQNLGAILDEAGSGLDKLVKTTVYPREPRRLRGDERGLRDLCRLRAAGASHGRDLGTALRRQGRDRGNRPRLALSPTTSARSGWTRGWSAARFATSCSAGRCVTPTSSSPGSGTPS